MDFFLLNNGKKRVHTEDNDRLRFVFYFTNKVHYKMAKWVYFEKCKICRLQEAGSAQTSAAPDSPMQTVHINLKHKCSN